MHIFKSVKFVDFINNIDNLINDLLYSKEHGFIYLKSKNALDEACNVVRKFDYELEKILNKNDFKNQESIVFQKKDNFIESVKKHCAKQLFVWVDEVYDSMIDNSLFAVSLDKSKADEIYNRCIGAIHWYCDIKRLSEAEKESLLKEFEIKFQKAFNSLDEDYLPNESPLKSDLDAFFEILDKVLYDDEFIYLDLDKFLLKLSNNDYNYFLNLQKEFTTNKKTAIKDDFMLVKSAIELLNLDSNQDKYEFIMQVKSDFELCKAQNNIITEQDKIDIVKKRMKLFSETNLDNCTYFKDLLSF